MQRKQKIDTIEVFFVDIIRTISLIVIVNMKFPVMMKQIYGQLNNLIMRMMMIFMAGLFFKMKRSIIIGEVGKL